MISCNHNLVAFGASWLILQEVGWRDGSLRIIMILTNAGFKTALDGKVIISRCKSYALFIVGSKCCLMLLLIDSRHSGANLEAMIDDAVLEI